MTTLTATIPTNLPANHHVEAASTSALNIDISSDRNLKRLHCIPTFAIKIEEQKWQKEQIAAAFRLFIKIGFANSASGHISLQGMLTS